MELTDWLTHLASLERRTTKRVTACYPMSYRVLGMGKPLHSMSKDISGTGVCMLTEAHISPGCVLQIEITVPNRPRPIHTIGRVVWCEPLVRAELPRSPRLYETGSHLLDISPEDQALLTRLL